MPFAMNESGDSLSRKMQSALAHEVRGFENPGGRRLCGELELQGS